MFQLLQPFRFLIVYKSSQTITGIEFRSIRLLFFKHFRTLLKNSVICRALFRSRQELRVVVLIATWLIRADYQRLN